MNLLNHLQYVYDIETDNLLKDVTKIHCLCYQKVGEDVITALTDYEEIKSFVSRDDVVRIGHNIVRYDEIVFKKILGIETNETVIDTLPLSWYLYPERKLHGLEAWGEEFGVPKPKIEDWSSLKVEDYIHRCTEDVKINMKLWQKQYRYLKYLYETEEKLDRFLEYINFKSFCVRDQEALGLRLDIPKIEKLLALLQDEKAEKTEALKLAMPKVPIIQKRKKPKVMTKKGGLLSVAGENWKADCDAQGLDYDIATEIGIIKGYEEPNPGSHQQIKDWLYGMGWVPETHQFVRDKKTGVVKQIPQVGIKNSGGLVCQSVLKLKEQNPAVELLEGLGIISHRISILNGFLRDKEGDRIYPSSAGLTNTLRLQHAVVVNLPGGDKKWGEDIRACIIADPGHILCGSDLSRIEDNTKLHYIYKYDPEYVKEQQIPGFDAHLDIGIRAEMLTLEDADYYKAEDKKIEDSQGKYFPDDGGRWKSIKKIRGDSKVVNFSATYKVGAATLARNSKKSETWAKKVLKVYWERNKAILEVEDSLNVKKIGNDMWQLQPVSGFWYSLRNEKDKFSTLNQGTAVYVFDLWLKYMRALGIQIAFQYHDEVLFNVRKGEESYVRDLVNEAMELVNKKLKLNVQVGCSVKYGMDYYAVH